MIAFAGLLFRYAAAALPIGVCANASAVTSSQQQVAPFITASFTSQDVLKMPPQSGWKECRDTKHGFFLRYPPGWYSATPEGRCAQLLKGINREPYGIPEVDVFIEVRPLGGKFPDDYLVSSSPLTRGVSYTDRQELEIYTLPAVRARFHSAGGPVPNWGVEFAIRKGDKVMKIYISQPKPEIEQQFDQVVKTLRW